MRRFGEKDGVFATQRFAFSTVRHDRGLTAGNGGDLATRGKASAAASGELGGIECGNQLGASDFGHCAKLMMVCG